MKKLIVLILILITSNIFAQEAKRIREFERAETIDSSFSILVDDTLFTNFKRINLHDLKNWLQLDTLQHDSTSILADTNTFTGLNTFENTLTLEDTLFLNSIGIFKHATEEAIIIEGSAIFTGGVMAYGNVGSNIGSVFDNIPLATDLVPGLAKFNPAYFSVDEFGEVIFIGESGSGFTVDSIPLATGFDPGIASFDTASFAVDEFGEVTFTGIIPEIEGLDTIFANWLATFDTTSILANDNTFTGENTFNAPVFFEDSVLLNGILIEKHATENALIINSSAIFTGGVMAYGNVGSNIGSVFDNIPLATDLVPGLASFNPASFSVDEFGEVTFIGSAGGVIEETDPIFSAWSEADPIFSAWNKSTGISILESQISNFGSYQPADADLTDLADGSLTAAKVQYNEYFITSAGTSGYTWKSDGVNRGYWGPDNIGSDFNYYLNGVSGSGNGTVTFTRSGLSSIAWDASHTHDDRYYTEAEANSNFGSITDVAANTTHRSSSGADHSYINQSVTTTASPTFITLYNTTTRSESVQIKNSSGIVKWTVKNNATTNLLEFENATGTLVMTLDQSGNLVLKGDVTAFGL